MWFGPPSQRSHGAPIVNARTIKRSVHRGSFSASLALEEPFWDALEDVAGREGRTLPEICAEIDAARPVEMTLASAVRVFVIAYYQALRRLPAEVAPAAEPRPGMTMH